MMLNLSQGKPWYQYKLGVEGMESSLAKRTLVVLVGEKLGMSWQCALTTQKANCNLGCT